MNVTTIRPIASQRPVASPITLARSMNVVVICHLGRSGYNVQRALAAIGVKCYLITDRRSASVRWSRGSKVLHHTAGDLSVADDDIVVRLINRTHERVGIVSVIPTDVTTSLMVARIRTRLAPSPFPTSPIETLNQLDNKWEFFKICSRIGVDTPKTLFFKNNAAVDLDAIAMNLTYPIIVKPVTGFGQRGIVVLQNAAATASFRNQAAHGHGMVVQEYITGQDWSISVLAVDGVVNNRTAWECPSQLDHASYGVSRFLVTKFAGHEKLISMVEAVVAATSYSGIANFDARLGDDGRMVLFECNPRIFNRLLAARICGLNFVAAGLPGFAMLQRPALFEGAYYPWREALTMRGWRLLMSGEWKWRYLARDVWEMLRDPIPPLVRKITREDEKAS
jgi:predicted ATP-grasp superfamily ATP-dependent carboligase